MYSVGDLILYGRTGVCRVEEISERLLSGEKTPRLFYTLKPLYQNCNISCPADNGKLFSRKIMSAEEAETFIQSLPALEAEPYHNRNLNQLREYYRRQVESYDCVELARLCLSIQLKRQECEAAKRKLGAVDERTLHEATELLFGELAAALGIEKSSVQSYIDAALAK